MGEEQSKGYRKWLWIAGIVIVLVLAGGWINEKTGILSFLGIGSLQSDLSGLKRELTNEIESLKIRESTYQKIVADSQAELSASQSDNRILTEKLTGLQDKQRREREIIAEFDRLIDSAAGPIGRAFGALDEVDRGAAGIERISGEIEQGLEGISEASRGPDPALEDNSDK